MSVKIGLNWSKVEWSDFQDLCIFFTQNELPELRLENYLKQGNNQKGIDLHSLKSNNGKYTFIQCKREKTLHPAGLTNIINEFTKNDLVNDCSDFIVITTADLQAPKSKDRQEKLKKTLKNEHNIDLQFWDKAFLEIQLQKYYSIVANFFGFSDANEHCHSKSLPPKTIDNPINYINRQIEKYNELTTSLWGNHLSEIDLEKFFTEDRFTAKRAVLLGEAHSGKSMQMQKVLYNLSNSNPAYSPISIDLKDLNVGEIARLLEINYGNWKNIPAKDLIIALDGLDEVPTDQFLTQVKYIKAFAIENPNISLIVCCRRLFFDHYEIKQEFQEFEIFELSPLNESSINQYLNQQLNLSVGDFYKKVNNLGIQDFLYSPFYLVQLVNDFKINPNEIPDNKITILNKFIASTLQNTSRSINGKPLSRQNVKYSKVLHKLAFALQLAGTNTFDDGNIQTLNPDEKDILLLQNSSIVNFKNNNWSFTNAVYQEHLAAQYLINLSFEEIIKLATNGTKIKKIKTKWLQTISSLFSLIDEKSPLYGPLIEFIKQDNIEIIFKTEGTKFSSDQITKFIDLLVEKLKIYNNRLQLINEKVIATFINSQPKAKDYCIQLINEDLTTPIKTVLAMVLKNVVLSETQQQSVKNKIHSEIFNISDDYYANQLLELSAEFNLANKAFIEKLTQSQLNEKYEFRDGVYQNILKLKMSDHFYDYALAGIPVLIQHNQKISNLGSYYYLEMVLSSFKSIVNAKKLLLSLKQAGNFELFERSINKRLFLKTLTENLLEIYKSDISILFPLLGLIKRIGSSFNKSEYEELLDFFNKTNSKSLALRILFQDFKDSNFWEFTYLLDENGFDYLLYEFEEGNISKESLWSIYTATDYYGDKNIANKFMLLCEAATENKFQPKRTTIHDDYEAYSEFREQNDLSFILSKKAFKKGLINYFKAFESDVITKNDLYITHTATPVKIKSNSLIIYHFLNENHPWDIIEKDFALETLKKIDFEWFQISEILRRYNVEKIKSNNSLFEVVKAYYYKKLPLCKFEETYYSKINDNGVLEHYEYPLYIKIADIFLEFEFDTPEEILLQMISADNGGIKNFEPHKLKNITSLTETIIKNISEANLKILELKILSNLKLGICDKGVLENHIGLCRHLKIYDSKSIIYAILTNIFNDNKYASFSTNTIIDIYLELDGLVPDLIPFFKQIKNFNAYCFFYLAKKIGGIFPEEVIPILKQSLYQVNTKEQGRFEIAHILVNIGEIEGLKFIVSHLKSRKCISDRYLGEMIFFKLDTKQALAQINEVCYLIVDETQKEIHWTESGQGIIRNWILNLADKSEEDLVLVNDFLIEKATELSSKYERHFDLHWYRLLAMEKFRDFNVNTLDINVICEYVN